MACGEGAAAHGGVNFGIQIVQKGVQLEIDSCAIQARRWAQLHADAEQPLQDFRHLLEQGTYARFAQIKLTFASVDKVGERFVFNIGGHKYRLVAAIAFQAGLVCVKAVLTHKDYDKGEWK